MTTKKTTKSKSSKTKASKKNNFKKELELEKDKNLRLFAEFENFRKRTAKERLELYSTANKDIMLVLLPILDNFERSIKANNYSDSDGPTLIYKQLKAELEKKALRKWKVQLEKNLTPIFMKQQQMFQLQKRIRKEK